MCTVSLIPRSRSTQVSLVGSWGKWNTRHKLSPRAHGGPPRDCASCWHRMNSDRYADDSKMHEMVAAAMEESWDVCRAHIDCIIGITRSVIADGVASGEFHTSDVGVAALCTCTAVMRFFHPPLIAEFADKPSPTLSQMIDFVIAGLSTPGNQRCRELTIAIGTPRLAEC